MEPGTQARLMSQKRPLDDDAPAICTPKKADPPSEASTPLTVLSSISTPSPLKTAAVGASQTSPAPTGPLTTATPATTQPAKRRKFTDKEKEEKRLEKDAKDRARAEQKAQKEEERRIKEEEKRKKSDEREEKKRAKELEQQQKDEEKRKREEEKHKKERSQMRLNAFFVKPKPAASSPGPTMVVPVHNHAPDTSLSTPDAPMQDANQAPVSPQKRMQQQAKSDYERFFLPFQLPSHAILAPYNRFMEDSAKLEAARQRLEKVLSQEDVAMDPIDIRSFRSRFSTCAARGQQTPSMIDIVERINSSSEQPIDLTMDDDSKSLDPLPLLKRIPMKYLHFPEDVRPPYYGTYTKRHTANEGRKLARNPFSRVLRETNYDYDSEAEWEEPEEGEDLDSDGEEDPDEEGDDDLEGFLDDEGDSQAKRRLISGDLEPVSTGLCWEGADGYSRLNDGSGAISTSFKGFEMGFLLEPHPQSIDPFSTSYWAPAPVPVAVGSKEAATGAMQPPRLPLAQRQQTNSMLNSLNTVSKATGKAAKPPKRMIPAEHLPEFKAQVEGSDLTKIALIEALKKKFPKLPKDAISNTLSSVAARVGPKEVEKRWVLL